MFGQFGRLLCRSGTHVWSRAVSRAPYSTPSIDECLHVTREPLNQYTVAHISINRPPVNSFGIQLALELSSKFQELTQSDNVHAIVLKSSLSNVFSAGLDIKELCGVSEEDLRAFFRAIQQMLYNVYTSRLTTLAAINGRSRAGGTVIAAACDHRICTHGDYEIGVVAAKVGMVPPLWFLSLLAHLMGQRVTEMYLQQGQVFAPEEAVKLGLVDEVCKPEELNERCNKALLPYLEVCHDTRAEIKLSLRRELIESYHRHEKEDIENFVKFTLRKSTQNILASMLKNY